MDMKGGVKSEVNGKTGWADGGERGLGLGLELML